MVYLAHCSSTDGNVKSLELWPLETSVRTISTQACYSIGLNVALISYNVFRDCVTVAHCNAFHLFVHAWICFRKIYLTLVCETSINSFRNKYDIIFSFNFSSCIFKYIAFLKFITPDESKHSILKCKIEL